MTTAMDVLEPGLYRRRCEDHSNDLEVPLLEATSSSTAKGEHKQESSKVDPSTALPTRLMLALFFPLFIEIMAITKSIQIYLQGREYLPIFPLGGVIGSIVDVIAVGVTFVLLAIYF
jgi:hypothetical protein